jgi:hypothetical protein
MTTSKLNKFNNTLFPTYMAISTTFLASSSENCCYSWTFFFRSFISWFVYYALMCVHNNMFICARERTVKFTLCTFVLLTLFQGRFVCLPLYSNIICGQTPCNHIIVDVFQFSNLFPPILPLTPSSPHPHPCTPLSSKFKPNAWTPRQFASMAR